MTVIVESNKNDATGNGVQTVFAFTFELLQSGDLGVYIDDALQVSGYTIEINSSGVGGEVTFDDPPANGAVILFVRTVNITQETALPIEGNLPESTLENMSDKLTMICQQLDEELGRALTVPVSLADTFSMPLPESLKHLRWNAAADSLENVAIQAALAEVEAGQGNVVGPASATNHALALFDGTTGRLLKGVASLGNLGQVLTSNGTGIEPSFQDAALGGSALLPYQYKAAWQAMDGFGLSFGSGDTHELLSGSGPYATGQDDSGRWEEEEASGTGGWQLGFSNDLAALRRAWGPKIYFVMRTGVITSARYNIGVFSYEAPPSYTNPPGHGASISYATDVDGTVFWRTWTKDGTTQKRTATTQSIVASTRYRMMIDMSDPSKVDFYINGVLVNSHTTQLPGISTDMWWRVVLESLSGNKYIRIEHVEYAHT